MDPVSVRPRLATVWLGGCSGCHMSFLDLDERLLELMARVDLVYSPFIDIKTFPEHVDIEVGHLELGQAIYVRDVATNASWAPLSDADLMLVHVVNVKAAAEPAAESATPAAAAEPEVAKKGKADKDGEDKDKAKK